MFEFQGAYEPLWKEEVGPRNCGQNRMARSTENAEKQQCKKTSGQACRSLFLFLQLDFFIQISGLLTSKLNIINVSTHSQENRSEKLYSGVMKSLAWLFLMTMRT